MSDNSKISWTDASWNPVTGCTEVSPGCAHCYAKTFAERWRGVEGNYFEHGFDVQLRPAKLEEPLKWKKPRRIFVNSMSDLFHEAIPDEYIDKVFAVMALTPQHTFQVLTKRIERAHEYLSATRIAHFDDGAPVPRDYTSGDFVLWQGQGGIEIPLGLDPRLFELSGDTMEWPLPNVLIGPTIENQHFADERLPHLLAIKDLGWRTMVSYEPALGPVDFRSWLMPKGGKACTCGHKFIHRDECAIWEPSAIDWLICGGESGVKRRPFSHEWARSALQQARHAGVPFFMKQDGAFRNEVYDTLPDDLKVREFPR